MPAKTANPLSAIPSADVVRRRLSETEREAEKLRILLDLAEKIERADSTPSKEAGA